MTNAHISAASVRWWGLESFFGCPQHPSRGLKWGDLKIRIQAKGRGEMAPREGVGNLIINSWDMEDTEVNVV